MRNQVFVCSGCGQPIYEGEDVLDYFGEQLCSRCVKKHTSKAVRVEEPPEVTEKWRKQ